ncbi:MAG TPA: hypothetical protein VMM78_18260 [Thermomicrobiales bacterium]|nr:hypothetical protein [Thermomicrobiales bacterium]
MGERAQQLMDEIEVQRQELGENLHVLEEKVRDTVDWRSQFEQHPMMGLGVAFAGGFLLSAILPGADSDSPSESRSYNTANYRVHDESQAWRGAGANAPAAPGFAAGQEPKRLSPEMREVTETIDNIRGAAMGLAAARLRAFLSDSVPGFKDEYEEARRTRGNSEATKMPSDGASGDHADHGQTRTTQANGSDRSQAPGGMPAEHRTGGLEAQRP